MKISKKMLTAALALASIFLFISPVNADVPAWFVEDMKGNEAILNPGTTTYCEKDFWVENMGDDMATVHVILGNGANYAFDQIEPQEKRSYSLSSEYPQGGGWEETRVTSIEEARIVNGTAGEAKLKVHCK